MEQPQGAFLKIPLGEVKLSEAVNAVEDASYWDESLPPILYHFRMSVDDYWELTVKQHRLLLDWLIRLELVKEPDGNAQT